MDYEQYRVNEFTDENTKDMLRIRIYNQEGDTKLCVPREADKLKTLIRDNLKDGRWGYVLNGDNSSDIVKYFDVDDIDVTVDNIQLAQEIHFGHTLIGGEHETDLR